LFLGEQVRSLDVKGRLTLPVEYRSQLAEGIVVTKGEDYCLHVYPLSVWGERQAEVLGLDMGTKVNREYRRAFFSAAAEVELDGQGRLLVRKQHRSYAGFVKDVTVIGFGAYIELWSLERWEAERQRGDEAIGGRDGSHDR